MALTYSTMMPLGTKAPAFNLLEPLTGQVKSQQEIMGPNGLLVMFLCNHCPFVQHIWSELNIVAQELIKSGVGVVAISSNDMEAFPEDAPDAMVEEAQRQGFLYPYLFDETQETAKKYQAACTPDFFLFDHTLSCFYRGQFDGSRPGSNQKVTGEDLREAARKMQKGEPPLELQKPSVGCNIKWKSTQ